MVGREPQQWHVPWKYNAVPAAISRFKEVCHTRALVSVCGIFAAHIPCLHKWLSTVIAHHSSSYCQCLQSYSALTALMGNCLASQICDFGKSLHLDAPTAMIKGEYGTITYMAEVLEHGHMSKAADVYSFGVLLWAVSSCTAGGWRHCGAVIVWLQFVLLWPACQSLYVYLSWPHDCMKGRGRVLAVHGLRACTNALLYMASTFQFARAAYLACWHVVGCVQMYTSSRPWPNLSHAQVLAAVVVAKLKLVFPSDSMNDEFKVRPLVCQC